LGVLDIIQEKTNISKIDIANRLKIVSRQVDYYINALRYFELISDKCRLTLKGKFISDPLVNQADKIMIFKNIIVGKSVFSQIDGYIIQYRELPSIETIISYIKENYAYSQSTLIRRASTVRSWFDFFIKNEIYGEL